MGIHQFKLEVVPRAFLGDPPVSSVPQSLLREGLTPWQNAPQPSDALLDQMRGLLPVEQSWGEVEEFRSNNEWPSKLRIWWSEDTVDNVQFSFSPIADSWTLMETFVSMVNQQGLMLVELNTGRTTEANVDTVKALFLQSRAVKFSMDPEGTILDVVPNAGSSSDA